MRKNVMVFSLVILFLLSSGTLFAYEFSTDTNIYGVTNPAINTDEIGPHWNGWFELELPTVSDEGWTVNSYSAPDSEFTISEFFVEMNYSFADPTETIEMYVSYEGDLTPYYDLYTFLPDINGGSSGQVSLMGLIDNFVGLESFFVGFGCHFDLSDVKVVANRAPVPEPGTMLLLGTGLIGLAGGVRRRFK